VNVVQGGVDYCNMVHTSMKTSLWYSYFLFPISGENVSTDPHRMYWLVHYPHWRWRKLFCETWNTKHCISSTGRNRRQPFSLLYNRSSEGL